MPSPRERYYRTTSVPAQRPQPRLPAPSRPRRHHFHDYPPWPHQRYGDYVLVEGAGWWPRWFPHWDRRWYDYWWYLFDHYGGDANPEYAEYARDAILRQNASAWGLSIDGGGYGGGYGGGGYGGNYGGYGATQVGIQPYGVAPAIARQPSTHAPSYRALALDQAKKIFAAIGKGLIGYRYSPYGPEITIFGERAGIQRWCNEQSMDQDVWYAAAFDIGSSSPLLMEVAR